LAAYSLSPSTHNTLLESNIDGIAWFSELADMINHLHRRGRNLNCYSGLPLFFHWLRRFFILRG